MNDLEREVIPLSSLNRSAFIPKKTKLCKWCHLKELCPAHTVDFKGKQV